MTGRFRGNAPHRCAAFPPNAGASAGAWPGLAGGRIRARNNQAARLVEAAPLKRQIAETGADLGLATSEFVYDTVISQSREPAELARYQKIRFRAKGSKAVAWMYLSGATRPNTPGRQPRTGLPG